MAERDSLLQARNNPKFLHSNSTSHVWIFSAFAELIDNAYDAQASKLHIDMIHLKSECITFIDNGLGMTKDKLYNMLSFGYCEKEENFKFKPIGQYGNGFKSGSMRIGKDAIVFTKEVNTMSVGLLSQTYLEVIEADTIYLPIVTFDKKTNTVLENCNSSLEIILGLSVFDTEDELFEQFESIRNRTGTKIIIYNLASNSENSCELDFTSDVYDIKCSVCCSVESSPKYTQSLREYCRILFLKPKMLITLREKKVEAKLIVKSLERPRKVTYKPRKQQLQTPIIITFGQVDSGDCGIMVYLKNRLIKGHIKVGFQKQKSDSKDRRVMDIADKVLGVVEVENSFLKAIHNKQDFRDTKEFRSFISVLGDKLNTYCEITAKDTVNQSEANKTDWVQCDECNKWRRLSPMSRKPSSSERWTCDMNDHLLYFSKCEDPEEDLNDEEDLTTQLAEYAVMRRAQRQNSLCFTPQKRRKSDQVRGLSNQQDDSNSDEELHNSGSRSMTSSTGASSRSGVFPSPVKRTSVHPELPRGRALSVDAASVGINATASTFDEKPDIDPLSGDVNLHPSTSAQSWRRNGFRLPTISSSAVASVQSLPSVLSLSRSVVDREESCSPHISTVPMSAMQAVMPYVSVSSDDVDSKLGIVMVPGSSGTSTRATHSFHQTPGSLEAEPALRDVLVQTDEDSYLINLRRNVLELLKICVPEFCVDGLSLTDGSVDELVIKVISAQ